MSALLRNLVPSAYGTYFEPFAGGAALFFSLRPQSAVIADIAADPIECYIAVRDHPLQLIGTLSRMRNAVSDYYTVRRSRPQGTVGRAARLIYLTNLAFNGIYRVNSRGDFNVPYGWRTMKRPYDAAAIMSASKALRVAELYVGDFEQVVAHAEARDFVYFDPPYTLAHDNGGFIRYNETLFSWQDQLRLAAIANELDSRGTYVVVSNAAHPALDRLYPRFGKVLIRRNSSIAADYRHRRRVVERVYVGKALGTALGRLGRFPAATRNVPTKQ